MAKDETQETGTEVATVFGGQIDLPDVDRMIGAMEDTVDEGGRSGDVSYMSFSGKRGRYSIGVEKREPGSTEPFLVAITMFELGWMAWKDSKPVGKRLANITQPKIPQPQDDVGGEWQRARSITVRSFETHEQCYFTNNSKSGVSVMSDLQRDVLERMKSGQPCWPVVTFGIAEFESQGHHNYKPQIDIIAWLDSADVQQLADPEFDPMTLLEAPEPAPAPRTRRRL